MVKGFTMDDERLKNPGGWDYFDELLERIQTIRASEKRFYQKVRDLFSQTSADYDGKPEIAQTFFKTIQNKMLFAITGNASPGLIPMKKPRRQQSPEHFRSKLHANEKRATSFDVTR